MTPVLVRGPASQQAPRSWLPPKWFYPVAAAGLVGCLLAVQVIRPALFPLWLGVGVVSAAAIGRLLALREQALWSMSSTDVATGLMNRRQFQEALERELAHMRRTHQPVALLMFDLDKLKQINDRLGHAAGDQALKAVAHAFRRCCRADDLIARWGGDEFAVVAQVANEHEARLLGGRLCIAVREASEGAMVLSVSGGIALADPDRPAVSRPSALFAAADRALYKAKARGGSHIEVGGHEVIRLKAVDTSDVKVVVDKHHQNLKRWPL
ncbi:MAG: GGDEF domain-containing protein [Myxococcaceae bacterium]